MLEEMKRIVFVPRFSWLAFISFDASHVISATTPPIRFSSYHMQEKKSKKQINKLQFKKVYFSPRIEISYHTRVYIYIK